MDQQDEKYTGNNIPHSFKGSARVYKTVGVQDSRIYGMNIATTRGSQGYKLELVFAVLGDLPDVTPFKRRTSNMYAVLYQVPDTDGVLQNNFVQRGGLNLNKMEFLIGKDASSFELLQHIQTELPKLKKWLDETLENAGIMPAYNDVDEIFAFFFGEAKSTAQMFPLELPEMKPAENTWGEIGEKHLGKFFPTLDKKPAGPVTAASFDTLMDQGDESSDEDDGPSDAQLKQEYDEYVEECEAEDEKPDSFEDWKQENYGD